MSLNLDFPKPVCKPEPQESQKETGGIFHFTSGLPPSVKVPHSERIIPWDSGKLSARNQAKAGVPLLGGLGSRFLFLCLLRGVCYGTVGACAALEGGSYTHSSCCLPSERSRVA